MARKQNHPMNTGDYQNVPQPQTPYIPRFPSTDEDAISGNPGMNGVYGAVDNMDTPHNNRMGIAVGVQPTEPKPAVTPYSVTPPPME